MNNWNQVFEKSGKLFGTEPSALVAKALQLWKPANKKPAALDVGAFTGRNALFLAKNGFTVVALEPASKPLKDLMSNAQGLDVIPVESTIESFAWKQSFDCIVCSSVLHLLTPEEVDKTISLMQKHTTQNGINVITAFTSKPFENQKKVFAHNELKEKYSSWEILLYEERDTKLAAGGNAKVADIIARKITT